MFIKQVPVGPMMNFAYLVGDREDKKIAVIDPGWEAEKIADEVKKLGVHVVAILITHTHFDHVRALQAFLAFYPARVYVHTLERKGIAKGCDLVETHDASVVRIGDVQVKCHHTPGHSPGSQCFECVGELKLFTGDTLFVGGCGRVDLPGSDPEAMKESLKKLSLFPGDMKIFPGHDYGPRPTSTIGEERQENPFLGEVINE